MSVQSLSKNVRKPHTLTRCFLLCNFPRSMWEINSGNVQHARLFYVVGLCSLWLNSKDRNKHVCVDFKHCGLDITVRCINLSTPTKMCLTGFDPTQQVRIMVISPTGRNKVRVLLDWFFLLRLNSSCTFLRVKLLFLRNCFLPLSMSFPVL